MRIGEFARLTGLTTRQLRYWSVNHLLAPSRSPSGYREYSVADARIAARIEGLLAAGLTIRQIQGLSSCLNYESGVCQRERAELKAKTKDIERRIAQLEDAAALIAEVLRDAPIIQPASGTDATDGRGLGDAARS
ncbi:MAG: MerR family transcriptional regulator [Bifidobacterium crudilactis]|jgi:DNA-binding transcriptional MerR regulator|uniref:MerR family transcriptional regulator n=1 Tax=Bifidobacterium crudilactis TaxID=327277 RepID=UPI00235320BA|nr:MerR family transcriptional regulator [Bifidobacterium crudilactis]MCI1890017.1 MerR family transcriptional regulator [Bifidobacterium crudilactis]